MGRELLALVPWWRQPGSLQAVAVSPAAGEPGTACPALWGLSGASRGLQRWLSNQTRSQRSVFPRDGERWRHELVLRPGRRSGAGQLVGGDEPGRIRVINKIRPASTFLRAQRSVDVNSRIECPTELLIDGY